MAAQELSYLAGFVDADGSVGITYDKSRRGRTGQSYPVLSVASVTPPVLKTFQKNFGGSIYRKNQKNRYKNAKPFWQWAVSRQQAVLALRQLVPFLRLKKRQAHLALSLGHLTRSRQKGGLPLTSEEIRVRMVLLKEMRRANG